MKLWSSTLAMLSMMAFSFALADEFSKAVLKEPLRTNYIEVFRKRLDTVRFTTEKKKYEFESAKNDHDEAVALNASTNGAVTQTEVARRLVAMQRKQSEVSASEARVLEAEKLLKLIEQTAPMGIQVPIVLEFQP